MTKKTEALAATTMKKVAPHAEQLAEVRKLLDDVNLAVITAVIAGRTDQRSIEALIADLRQTVKAWGE